VAQLRAHHHTSQTTEGPEAEAKRFSGLDLINGVVRDNLAAGVVEPAISKIKSLRCVCPSLSPYLSLYLSLYLSPYVAISKIKSLRCVCVCVCHTSLLVLSIPSLCTRAPAVSAL
jgi:hypothetical protein